MAKAKAAAATAPATVDLEMEDYRARILAQMSGGEFMAVGADIVGFWTPEKPNDGEPIHVQLVDQTEFETRYGMCAMLAAVIVDAPPGGLTVMKREALESTAQAKVGDVIGIIQTADLKKLDGMMCHEAIIFPAGMREVPNRAEGGGAFKMKAFKCAVKTHKGKPQKVFTNSLFFAGDTYQADGVRQLERGSDLGALPPRASSTPDV